MKKFFIQLGIGEKAGSGADFIVKGWQDNKWDRPQLEEKVQPDVVTLTFQLKEVDFDSLSQVGTSLWRKRKNGVIFIVCGRLIHIVTSIKLES